VGALLKLDFVSPVAVSSTVESKDVLASVAVYWTVLKTPKTKRLKD
jgi:hypothetical protein